MRTTYLALVTSATLLATTSGLAQKLPAPSRTVFKCEKDGKVVYSDSPCLGAQRIDVEPTQGLNKMSGTERVGHDVRQERHNEAIAEAMRPIFNETTEQRAKRHRRAKLSPQAQSECGDLDGRISATELEERQAKQADRPEVQSRLFRMRSQYKELKC